MLLPEPAVSASELAGMGRLGSREATLTSVAVDLAGAGVVVTGFSAPEGAISGEVLRTTGVRAELTGPTLASRALSGAVNRGR